LACCCSASRASSAHLYDGEKMYESFYNLRAKPFQLSPDAKFFYNSRGHKRALSYLRYGITQGEGFIVILGGIGTGKTTMVQALFDQLEDDGVVAAKLVTTQLEADDLLRLVATSFGLSADGASKASILKQLEAFFLAQSRLGKRVLLVVDEVQNMPMKSLEELRMLSNFQVGGTALLQIFLLGQQEFTTTLQATGLEQLRQRIIASYYLKALDQDEVKGYIEHRLTSVGWQGDPSFDESAYSEIYSYTSGVPRKINTFCDRLMLFGYLEEIHDFTAGVVLDVVSELQGEVLYVQKENPEAPRKEPKASQELVEMEQRLCVLEEKVEAFGDGLRSQRSLLARLWPSR